MKETPGKTPLETVREIIQTIEVYVTIILGGVSVIVALLPSAYVNVRKYCIFLAICEWTFAMANATGRILGCHGARFPEALLKAIKLAVAYATISLFALAVVTVCVGGLPKAMLKIPLIVMLVAINAKFMTY